MKQMMFTKGIEEPVIEVNNDNTEDGQDDDEKPAGPGEVKDSRSDDESEDDLSEGNLSKKTNRGATPSRDQDDRSGRIRH
jgi:hypothetical protein